MTPRKEEKIVIAEIVSGQITVDKTEFTDYSIIYDDPFIPNYKLKIIEAKGLVTTEILIAEGKVLTEMLYADVDSLKVHMNKLEGYVKRAIGMTVKASDFGIHEVREKINSKDVEGLLMRLSTVILNAENNMTILDPIGYKAAALTSLKDLKDKIDTENVKQTLHIDAKMKTVDTNNTVFDELDAITKDVIDAGKRIYKFSNKVKFNEYNYKRLLAKVRHERNALKTEENKIAGSCVVYVNCTDADDNPLEEMTVTISEFGLVLKTDEDGTAYFEEVTADAKKPVTIIIEGEGYVNKTLEKQILEPGGMLNLDVVMVPIAPAYQTAEEGGEGS